MGKRCICTIICSNYIAYARTQYDSLRLHDPQCDYFVYVVDADANTQKPFKDDRFTVVVPAQLFDADEYRRYSFLYNALELSTNVKPSLLKYLIRIGYSEVIYLDPDINIYNKPTSLFDHFSEGSILLTPHALCPHEGELRPNDQDFLAGGIFNLGFIGVKYSHVAAEFLDWWEQRCLKLGYNEVRSGLMVDQKWVNLAPCYFDGVTILKNPGYNVAYWNLHERRVSKKNGVWHVNDEYPLIFYHFSGIRFDKDYQISKHQNRFSLDTRNELVPLFKDYCDQLVKKGIAETFHNPYKYGTFDNGEGITDLARKMYYSYSEEVDGDPFCSSGDYYRWLKRNRMVGFSKTSESYNSMNYNTNDIRIKIIHRMLKLLLFLLGSDKYLMLMKYLSFISIIRNQNKIFIYSERSYLKGI